MRGKHRAMGGLCPLLGGILQPQLQRIHLQRFGEFIEHATRPALGADRRALARDRPATFGAVGEHVEADRQHVRGYRREKSCSRQHPGSAKPGSAPACR